MASTNLACVLYKAEDLRLENIPIPSIEPHEVLIEMDCVGICGSDVKFYLTGKCGCVHLKDPIIIGHEGSGVIYQVGSAVSGLKVGDRVAVEPTQPCARCAFCKDGRYNLCAEPRYCCTPDAPGNLSHFYKHCADFCHKLPDNVSMEEGAAVQPLAIAVHACRRAGVQLGDVLLVLGAGPIGVMTLLAARAMGASRVILTDVLQSRLDKAKELGADEVLLVKPEDTNEEVVANIKKLLGGEPDISIDACGLQSTNTIGMLATRRGGTLLVVGIGAPVATVPLSHCLMSEIDVRGSWRFSNTYGAALRMVSSGRVPLRATISHHFKLARVHDAISLARDGTGLKAIVHLQPRDANNITPFTEH